MSDNKPINDWVKDWEALQRQYLNAWSDLAQKTPFASASSPPSSPFSVPFGSIPGMPGMSQGATSGMPPWHEGLEQWARLFGSAGTTQSDTVERVVESGKSYIAMIKAMLSAGSPPAGAGADNPAQAWFDAMRGGMNAPSGFDMSGMDAGLANNPFVKAIRDIAGQGAKGFGELPAAFAPFIDQMRQEGMSWLRMPAFGLAREHQEHYQRTAVAFVEYQKAMRNYNALLLKASQRGFELLEDKLAERSEPGRAIDSPRALYDLWVDAAEDAYAEVALSDEFAKAYGELANSQMRMRAQIQAEVERIGTDLGMPTRTELNSVHQRLHDLRRDFRESRETQSGGDAAVDVRELEAQIAELRAEIGKLNGALGRTQQTARPSRTTVESEAAKRPAASSKTVEHAKPARAQRARSKRRAARRAAPTPSVAVKRKPAAVPKPTAEPAAKTSFGDAIAAMRRRVASSRGKKSARTKAVAAGFAKPAKADRVAAEKSKKSARKSARRNR